MDDQRDYAEEAANRRHVQEEQEAELQPDRKAQVDRAAAEQVRAAQHDLAKRLRALAQEANQVADALALAGPSDRVTTCLAGRYESVRYAMTMLEAARTGASRMREEVRRAE